MIVQRRTTLFRFLLLQASVVYALESPFYSDEDLEDLHNHFPQVAYLQIYNLDHASLCSGTLIAPSVILTAAHCVEGIQSAQAIFAPDAYNAPRSARKVYTMQSYHAHPYYDQDSLANDIALIFLTEKVYDQHGPMMPMPLYDKALQKGDPMTLVGYGKVRPDLDWSKRGKRRVGENVVSFVGTFSELYETLYRRPIESSGSQRSFYYADLDIPGSRWTAMGAYKRSSRQAVLEPGDSGGPALYHGQHGYAIAGVASHIVDRGSVSETMDVHATAAKRHRYRGRVSGWTPVERYHTWLQKWTQSAVVFHKSAQVEDHDTLRWSLASSWHDGVVPGQKGQDAALEKIVVRGDQHIIVDMPVQTHSLWLETAHDRHIHIQERVTVKESMQCVQGNIENHAAIHGPLVIRGADVHLRAPVVGDVRGLHGTLQWQDTQSRIEGNLFLNPAMHLQASWAHPLQVQGQAHLAGTLHLQKEPESKNDESIFLKASLVQGSFDAIIIDGQEQTEHPSSLKEMVKIAYHPQHVSAKTFQGIVDMAHHEDEKKMAVYLETVSAHHDPFVENMRALVHDPLISVQDTRDLLSRWYQAVQPAHDHFQQAFHNRQRDHHHLEAQSAIQRWSTPIDGQSSAKKFTVWNVPLYMESVQTEALQNWRLGYQQPLTAQSDWSMHLSLETEAFASSTDTPLSWETMAQAPQHYRAHVEWGYHSAYAGHRWRCALGYDWHHEKSHTTSFHGQTTWQTTAQWAHPSVALSWGYKPSPKTEWSAVLQWHPAFRSDVTYQHALLGTASSLHQEERSWDMGLQWHHAVNERLHIGIQGRMQGIDWNPKVLSSLKIGIYYQD